MPFVFNFSAKLSLVMLLLIAASSLHLRASIDRALVESTILINLNSLTDKKSVEITGKQRRLSNPAITTIQTVVDINQSSLPNTTSLTSSLTKTFNSFPQENLLEALQYSISYLVDGKEKFNFSESALLAGIKSSLISYFDSSLNRGEDISTKISDIPYLVYSSVIPNKANTWNQSIPLWSRKLSEILVQSLGESQISENLELHNRSIVKNATKALLKILNESTNSTNGMTGSISSVDTSRNVRNENMLFDGSPGFMKFDPEKTRFLEFASKGLADGMFSGQHDSLNPKIIEENSKILGEETMSGAIEFISQVDGDNSLFAYESTKAMATGLTLSIVYASSSKEEYREQLLAQEAAEQISNSISSQVISSSLELKTGFLLNRLAESVSFGSSMGAQLASVLDKSWDYEENWELYSRNALAKATAKGSANGALNAASKYIQNDPNIEDTLDKTTRAEILSVASGSALGSLIGNTGLAVYYPTLMQPIINQSAQGATYGGITAENLSLIDKPKGVTEEFEIEIARAIAHGAAHGALFQIVGLKKDSLPDKRTYDFETISAAEAVSYGSTYGAITGGISSGEDGLIIKQAIYQGTSEGATVGASLALGYDEQVADSVELKSSIAIKSAIKKTNDEAAVKANSTMAVKTIQTSSQDMLLLMRKFNINPLYTNPTKIFSNPDAVDEENLPFKDKFPFASPI